MTYRIVLSSAAQRGWNRLPEKARHAVAEFLRGPLAENPYRVGKGLSGELEGQYSARRGEYRVVYVIDDEEVLVEVVKMDHRRDVYHR